MNYYQFLVDLGISKKLSGSYYIAHLLSLYYENVPIFPLTKYGYNRLSDHYNYNQATIIKKMQYAIDNMFSCNLDSKLLYNIFGLTIDEKNNRPTNKQFIMTIIDYLDNRCVDNL